jgi:hypothetical protein
MNSYVKSGKNGRGHKFLEKVGIVFKTGRKSRLVEMRGVEPLTSAVRVPQESVFKIADSRPLFTKSLTTSVA